MSKPISLEIKGQKNSTEDSLKYILEKDGAYFGLSHKQAEEVVRILLPYTPLSSYVILADIPITDRVVTKQ